LSSVRIRRLSEAAAERLAIEIRQRLESLPGPNLVPCWTTRKTSQALSRELGRHDSFIRAMEVLADGKLATVSPQAVRFSPTS
jgi:hypothetical protein